MHNAAELPDDMADGVAETLDEIMELISMIRDHYHATDLANELWDATIEIAHRYNIEI